MSKINVQRSMSDEQMLVKYGYDKLPYLYPDGHRNDVGGSWARQWPKFIPRPEYIPSRDWAPWIDFGGDRYEAQENGEFKFDPRPEFVRPRVNIILSKFRESDGTEKEIIDFAKFLVANLNLYKQYQVAPEQITFAFKVLTRFVNIYDISN